MSTYQRVIRVFFIKNKNKVRYWCCDVLLFAKICREGSDPEPACQQVIQFCMYTVPSLCILMTL